MENLTTSFSHNGSIGDVWAAIPAMNEYYRFSGRKIILYLVNGVKAFYYEGASHPTKNANNDDVMLNENMINMMIPLLKTQEWCADAPGEHSFHRIPPWRRAWQRIA